MKFFSYGKDGGPESTVSGFWFVEIKSLFSIVLLKFEDGSRDAYHEHAFDAVSWLLSGKLVERHLEGTTEWFWNDGHGVIHVPSCKPILTKRSTFHKVISLGTTWVLSFRGPWNATWSEYLVQEDRVRTLTNGRKEV